jgi:indole-3-glycerol phosphate synthase
MSILDTIVEYKKKEIESCKELITIKELENAPYYERKTLRFRDYLLNPKLTGIIAEYKRQSPSKGIINSSSSVTEVTKGYAKYGASAISVLTDFNFFGGSADDLLKARAANNIPILRKEFILDEYQIIEAKALGADIILLIASILTPDVCKNLAQVALSLGLQVLLEIHDETELDRINEYVDFVGVNNRNLNTFELDLKISASLAKLLPVGMLKISESGISTAEDILFLKHHDH